VIAVDGPAASGKGTIAAGVAAALGFHLLDSGSLYRLVALKAIEKRIGLSDESALADAALRLDASFSDKTIRLDGRDVTAAIRTPAISRLTSRLTTLAMVRDKMTPIQRSLAAAGGVVLEGRDTGSVVWPDAEVKFYLDADLDTRARRRRADLVARGLDGDLETVREDIARRDRQDMERALAPLVKPAGAVVVDTAGLGVAEVVDALLRVIEQARCCTRS
jgi:cytidylate kinase